MSDEAEPQEPAEDAPETVSPPRDTVDGLWSVLARAREVADAHRSRGESVPDEVRDTIEMLEGQFARAVTGYTHRELLSLLDDQSRLMTKVQDATVDRLAKWVMAMGAIAALAVAISIVALFVARS